MRNKEDLPLHYDENEELTKYDGKKGEGFSDKHEDELMDFSDDIEKISNNSEDEDWDCTNDNGDEVSTEADEKWSEHP